MKNETEQNWDEMSAAYENFTEDEDSYSYTIEWPCIEKMLPKLDGKKVLDLGCGTGRFDFLFEKENPLSILGVDISQQMLNIAKNKAMKRSSKVKFIQYDINNLNTYNNEQFDFIFSSTTFHYIRDINGLFKNMYNLLEEKAPVLFR